MSEFSNQTIIERAVIKRMDGSELNLMDPDQGNTPFFRLIMRESMFDPSVSGTLFVQDKKEYGETLNFVGGEIFEITIKTPITEADEDLEFPNDPLGLVSEDNLIQNLKFYIHRVQHLTDDATLRIDAEKGPGTMWNLDFGPYELTYFNKTDAPFYGGEFIGKIADEDGEGLLNYFADKYFNPTASDFNSSQEPMDIEPTSNSIWLKGNNATYPAGRRTPHLELGRLINYVVESSVSESNPSAVNYMFWQDLNKWHFRSIDSLINLQTSPRTYKINTDKNGKDVILNFRISKLLDQSELINCDAYKSFYTHVEPNHDDPYTDYMPVNDKLKRERIDYDYTIDYDSWSHIESNPVLPDFLQYENVNGNEIHDDINGWFSVDEYNDQNPTKLDYYGNDNHKNTMKCWQTNFDQTDLDYELLKKIRTNVIIPAKTNYDLYVKKRLLKEKWNVYKYSLCCDKQTIAGAPGGSGSRILGYITGFERFEEEDEATETNVRPRDVWKYNWVPVEMWPREEVSNLSDLESGITYEIVAEEGPFTIIKMPTEEGVTLEAWNLNELNNEWLPGGVDDEPYLDQTYQGPGYNVLNQVFQQGGLGGDEIDGIPEQVKSQYYIPIGGELVFNTGYLNPETPDNSNTPLNLTIVNESYIRVKGQVVELFELPTDLSIIGKTGAEGSTAGPSESIYVFNAENAVDGNCYPSVLGEIDEDTDGLG